MKITKNDKYLQTVIFVILLCLSVRGGEGLMEDQIPFGHIFTRNYNKIRQVFISPSVL